MDNHRPSSPSEEMPRDLFYQIYEVELGNAENQVYVDFCPSYVTKNDGAPLKHQTFWQHFQNLLDAARLYARNPVIVEALAELMLEQRGDVPKIREARILDIASKPDELKRRFQRHYDDSDRNIVINEKWERFQERYAQASEGHVHYGDGINGIHDQEDDTANDQEDDDGYSYESEDVKPVPSHDHHSHDHHSHGYGMKQAIPWAQQANAGAGVPPPYILAQMEMARKRQREQQAHAMMCKGSKLGGDDEEVKTNDGSYRRRLDPYTGSQVITHPYQTSHCSPWNAYRATPSYPLTKVEESLCQEVAGLKQASPSAKKDDAKKDNASDGV